MSMPDIRTFLQARLLTVSGIKHVYETAPESINDVPAAYFRPSGGSYHWTAGSDMQHQFEVVLLVQKGGSWDSAQKLLDLFVDNTGISSVLAAIEGSALSGHVVQVVGYRDYGGMVYADVQFFGVRFDVAVTT